MKYISKIIISLICLPLYSQEFLIKSDLSNIKIGLEQNQNFKIIVANINIIDNNLCCKNINLFFELFNDIAIISTQTAIIMLKKDQPHILKINAFNNKITYQQIIVISKNIDLFINLEKPNANDIVLEPGCIIQYKDFKLKAQNKIVYFNKQINSEHLLLELINFKQKISIESVKCNIAEKQIVAQNLNMNYSQMDLTANAKIFKYENNISHLNDITIKIKDTNSTVEYIEINKMNNINLKNIKCNGKKFLFYSPQAKLELETKQIIFQNCEIKISKVTLKIDKIVMKLDTKKANLFDIIVLSNNKEISKCKSGTLNLDLESSKISYNLSHGNVNI